MTSKASQDLLDAALKFGASACELLTDLPTLEKFHPATEFLAAVVAREGKTFIVPQQPLAHMLLED